MVVVITCCVLLVMLLVMVVLMRIGVRCWCTNIVGATVAIGVVGLIEMVMAVLCKMRVEEFLLIW